MSKEDKICCWISWNIFIRIFIFILLLGIIFHIFKFEKITIFQLASGLGALIGFYLFFQRNKIFEKQLIQKDEQYLKDSEFKNFLEATKLLTSKDSTIEAKISAIYLLYDISKTHSDNLDRVIQIINKKLIPLIRYLEKDISNDNYQKKIINQEITNKDTKTIYEFSKNDFVNINNNNNLFRTIKEWEYKGNETEKIIVVVLKILKNILLEIILSSKKYIDLSNTIFFNLDTDFHKNIMFDTKGNIVDNIIFLECKLEKINFKNVIYYNASFINCNLTGSNFENANLWGNDFINCNLKEVNFKETECEGVSFEKCVNLTKEQLDNMKFEFKKEIKENFNKLDDKADYINTELVKKWCQDNFYPIFIDEETKINIRDIIYFDSGEEYQKLIELKNIFVI